jgi:hypothetical protein
MQTLTPYLSLRLNGPLKTRFKTYESTEAGSFRCWRFRR